MKHNSMKNQPTLLLAILVAAAIAAPVRAVEGSGDAVQRVRGPRDLALTCHSDFDNAEHPYRLYLPSANDGEQAAPLLVALHGTGGDQNKYFDHPTYGDGIYKREAEKRGIAIPAPSGGDPLSLPTEWRGVGELHVLRAFEDVCRNFKIDRDRIELTGQSTPKTGRSASSNDWSNSATMGNSGWSRTSGTTLLPGGTSTSTMTPSMPS